MRGKIGRFSWLLVVVALALILTQPTFVAAAGNPLCPGEDVGLQGLSIQKRLELPDRRRVPR